MAQTSWFWDGTVLGDASNARYSANTEFMRAWELVLGSGNTGYVIPDHANNLNLSVSGAIVTVDTGASYIAGWIHEVTAAETLTISANVSGNPRIDRIIITVNWALQTARVGVLEGTPNVLPTMPSLTQVYGTTWEVSLGYIWVANGFVSLNTEDLFDERVFIANTKALLLANLHQNLIQNSEMFGFVDQRPHNSYSHISGWQMDGVNTVTETVTIKPLQMARGRAVNLVAVNGGDEITTEFPIKGNITYSIKALVKANVGDDNQIEVTTDGTGPDNIIQQFRRLGEWIEVIILYTTVSDATIMTITYNLGTLANSLDIGQIMCIKGYFPGDFRPFHETLALLGFIEDSNWNDTAKSTATTTIDFTTDFSGLILSTEISGLFILLRGRDSGSAGASFIELTIIAASVYKPLSVDVTGVVDNEYRMVTGLVPTNSYNAVASDAMGVRVEASGANTFDATVKIIGMLT